jgi:predicted thioredoxin/glutaredoxin
MRLTTDRVPVVRVTRGMSIDQVREIWRVRSQAKTQEIMDRYVKQKAGRSGGREGLGIYGQFQSRAAREKVRLAERLLKSAGLPTDEATVRKVMRR